MSQSNPNQSHSTTHLHAHPEVVTVEGAQLADRVKELLHEGNVRRLIIRHDGQTVLEIPVTLGVIGALMAPAVAVVAAVGALLTHCTIEIHRTEGPDHPGTPPTT